MSKNPGIEFSDENFDIKTYFKETMSAKRQEIEQQEYNVVITPTEIGKATINTNTHMKDMAMKQVSYDIQMVANKENKREGEEI